MLLIHHDIKVAVPLIPCTPTAVRCGWEGVGRRVKWERRSGGWSGAVGGRIRGGAFQLLHVRHDFLLCFTFLTLALGPTAPTRLRFLFATPTPPSTIQTRIPPTPLPTTRAALLDKNLRNFSTIPSAIGMHNNNAKKSSYKKKKKRKYNKIK